MLPILIYVPSDFNQVQKLLKTKIGPENTLLTYQSIEKH